MPDFKFVSIPLADGLQLSARWYLPARPDGKQVAAITMAHGFAGIAAHGLLPFAEALLEAGFAVIVHEHRNFAESEGAIRGDIDPWQQIADWRNVIAWLAAREEVDDDRIGLWGTSYAGGHALVLAATDSRLRCIVSQVPTISGYEQGLRRISPQQLPALNARLNADEEQQILGGTPLRVTVASTHASDEALYRTQEAADFYHLAAGSGHWENHVTLRSLRAARMYEPGLWIDRNNDKPLLMIVATEDDITPTDLALKAFEKAPGPKQLTLIPGGHFSPYLEQRPLALSTAVNWYKQHL